MASFTVPHIVCIASHRIYQRVSCVVLWSSPYKSSAAAAAAAAIVNNINIMIVSLSLARYSLISLIVSRGKHSKLHAALAIAAVWATPTFKSQFRMWSARVMRTIYTVRECGEGEWVSLSCECIRINAFCRNNKTKWISDYEHPTDTSVYNQYISS